MYRIPNTDQLIPCEAEGCLERSPASRSISVGGKPATLCDGHTAAAVTAARARLGLPPLSNTPGGAK